MKASEFYEKYWKVDNGRGEMVPPPPLTEKEKANLDGWAESCVNVTYMQIKRKATGEVISINLEGMEKLSEQMKKQKLNQ